MIITAIRILFGPLAPDPTYKNLYAYDADPGTPPNSIPYYFFDRLTDLDTYDVPFPENGTIYPIGETETGFTIEIPTDGGFPARPLYLILTTEAGYRYAFVDSYTRTASSKIRCVARFDQWTENFTELYDSAEWSFVRSHQRRYVDRYASPRVKIYNGLSDPVAEGMVQGTKQTIPVPVFGATEFFPAPGKKATDVPVWMYWRLATTHYWTGTGNNMTEHVNPGMDPLKGSVPVMALCLGAITYYHDGSERPVFSWLNQIRVETEDGQSPAKVANMTSADIMTMIWAAHPYLVQAYITTIPPVNSTVHVVHQGDPSRYALLTVKDDAFYNNGKFVGDGETYSIGETAQAALALPTNGTLVCISGYSAGDVQTVPLTSAEDSGAFDPRYEIKIEEAPFEGKSLQMFGAEIDVSPTRAIPDAVLSVTLGAHNDLRITTADGVEIYRAAGVCSQFGVDVGNDSLTTWLVSNYNTYQNAKMWKVAGAGLSGVVGIGTGIATGNYVGAAMAAVKTGMSLGETFTSETAMKKDLQSSPNATTIPSQNAVDNFPLLDLPTISKRTIPDDVKARIMDYWHVYGYPDNRVGTIRAGIVRESFIYMQASLVRPPAGLYPAEYTAIESAFRSGVWIWNPTATVFMPGHIVTYEISRLTPLLSLDNGELT